jgi:hypothetical protein
MSNAFTTLTSVNKSSYDDGYYGQIDPAVLRELVIALKGWKNTPEGGGEPYISMKWSKPMDSAPAAPAAPASFEDIPF